jgi:cobyrinic acid a,c-diamide synthase
MRKRAFIVSAARSGSGKTTVTLAILAAWARQGIAVRAAKSGPDYIDPGFHAAASGADSFNLDSWAMPARLIDRLMAEATEHADVLVIEGAMGLFDGVAGPLGRSGSAADLAARYQLPVLVVLDVSGQSQTAAAVVRGLAGHDPAVRLAGVVLNRVGSARHQSMVTDAIAPLGVPVLGAIGRDDSLKLPERHLGLVQASEQPELGALLERLADMAEARLDLATLLGCLPSRPVTAGCHHANDMVALAPPGQRIALAIDPAFTFVYPHLIAGWQQAGAEIVPFSPLKDEPPPPTCDCCWLPGGYPELHAAALAAATRFRAGLRSFAQSRRIHGECGGYMVLGTGLEDARGERHAMAGLLGHSTSFASRRLQLGYRSARPLRDSIIGSARSRVRGHEFHYVTLLETGDDEPLVALADAHGRSLGTAGSRRGQVSGTFFHAIAQDGAE